jgi:5'-nucleotidase
VVQGRLPDADRFELDGAEVYILLTNDDGIYAPGLAAIERELRRVGEVCVVAPATEQSGVGHAITYLTPLIVKEVYDGDRRWGWAVEGSPADCVRIAISELCPQRPDLVVSGINGGLNAGINVLYSGTVAAAIEGAFFGITSVAVSLEFDEHARFDKAAALARAIIEQVLRQKRAEPRLYNVNIPTAALLGTPAVRTVPMDVTHYGERFQRRVDPWGRPYYWATGEPPPRLGQEETDLTALKQGLITLTPLDYNMTKRSALADMQRWQFAWDGAMPGDGDRRGPSRRPVVAEVRAESKSG